MMIVWRLGHIYAEKELWRMINRICELIISRILIRRPRHSPYALRNKSVTPIWSLYVIPSQWRMMRKRAWNWTVLLNSNFIYKTWKITRKRVTCGDDKRHPLANHVMPHMKSFHVKICYDIVWKLNWFHFFYPRTVCHFECDSVISDWTL